MPDDSFADGFGLWCIGLERFEQVEGDNGALKLKGQVGAGLILGCGADVV